MDPHRLPAHTTAAPGPTDALLEVLRVAPMITDPWRRALLLEQFGHPTREHRPESTGLPVAVQLDRLADEHLLAEHDAQDADVRQIGAA